MSEYLIETKGVSRSFSGFMAVDGVDLKVRPGSIHALIGPNGAGKTTLFNLISRFLEPTSGRVLYKGRDITRTKPSDLAMQGLVRSFQISATFMQMTVLENVRLALQRRRTSDSYKFWKNESSLSFLDEQALELLDSVGLVDLVFHRPSELSYGRKRALEMATTLAMDPEVLLLDEPTAGMGREDIDRIAELIQKASKGRTVLMVEHNLSFVSQLSDHITVLTRGRILSEGAYRTVASDPRVIEAYMGRQQQPSPKERA